MYRGNDARVRRARHRVRRAVLDCAAISYRALWFRESRPEVIRAVRNGIEGVHYDRWQRAIDRRTSLGREEKEFVAQDSVSR